jgi:hypothetical protein
VAPTRIEAISMVRGGLIPWAVKVESMAFVDGLDGL